MFSKLDDHNAIILKADRHTDPELTSSGHKGGTEMGEHDQPQ